MKFILSAIALCLFGLLVATVMMSQSNVEQQKVIENGGFRLKITRLASSLPVIMPPSYYIIESSHSGDGWHVVKKWSQDDPWPVSDIDLKVLTPTVAYYFRMVEMGVTTDGGNSWNTFDLYSKSISDGVGPSADHRVPKIELDATGVGTIFMQSYEDKNAPKTVIYSTKDFGKNWELVKISD